MEFQAVIFCGQGSKLEPIARPGSTKALLPVANRALLDYVLAWCKKALFSKIILAVTTSAVDDIKNWAQLENKHDLDIVSVPGETGEALAMLAPHITSDFVVLPCDFITEIDPESLVAAHRLRSHKNIITGFYYRNTFETLDKKTLVPDILLHSSSKTDSVLLDAYSRQAIKDAKRLDVRTQMLWKYSDVTASTDVLYSAIYFCRRKVLDIIADSAGDDNIDLQGHTIHKLVRDFARRTWQHRWLRDEVSFQILPASPSFLRANNLPAYLEANRYQLGQKARSSGRAAPAAAKDKNAAVIGNDAIVDESSKVGERSSIKKSAVGGQCEIGAKCRLTGCVLLGGVTVENDAVLENCIIGPGAIIRAKARLTNCQVEGGYEVSSGTEAKNEVLRGLSMNVDEDEYENLYESLSDDDDEDDDDDDEELSESEEDDYEDDDDGNDFFDRS